MSSVYSTRHWRLEGHSAYDYIQNGDDMQSLDVPKNIQNLNFGMLANLMAIPCLRRMTSAHWTLEDDSSPIIFFYQKFARFIGTFVSQSSDAL